VVAQVSRSSENSEVDSNIDNYDRRGN
jgi:hypothetical protein